MTEPQVTNQADLLLFQQLVHENRFDLCKLVYIIFPFGEPGHALESEKPYDWQMEEWKRMSEHLSNPLTRYLPYRLAVSSGNGAAKTAFGAMTMLMLMYTQKLRGRVTANTKPQLTQIIWPEYDVWLRHARYNEMFFDKLGESIKAKDEKLAEQWRFDQFTWDDATPARVSGLHNKGHAILYTFEEAAGIPGIIFKYAAGAFTDINTIKIWLAFANSDDPNSYFEGLSNNPDWRFRRIDTRTLGHVDKAQIEAWLRENDGDEDSDDFRVRVRGLPRKTAADSIIKMHRVQAAIERGREFDPVQVKHFPCILTCDPAWQGGDETTIWMHQGHYSRLLRRYKLNREANEDHRVTYDLLCKYERDLRADAVLIDQGEGTAIKTLANNDHKWNWELVSFANSPNDQPDPKESPYGNIRAQIYYQANEWMTDGVLTAEDEKDLEDIMKQLPWTKGTRHKITGKKMCESKKELRDRMLASPDLADGFVLRFARQITDRLPENELNTDGSYGSHDEAGSRAYDLPESIADYSMESYNELYRN